MSYIHIPVMLEDVLKGLDPRPGENFIDGTLGGAGYSEAIAKLVSPTGKVLAVDLDEMAIENAWSKNISNLEIYQSNFAEIEDLYQNSSLKDKNINGLVLDLGLSSAQLSDEDRGFSYKSPGPLNMYFSGEGIEGAYEVVNFFPEKKLADIIYLYGEETRSRQIAKAITQYRKKNRIETAQELSELINNALPFRAKINPATKTFQALRIFANKELESLEKVLKAAENIISPSGILAIVSFHSLEDRLIKQYLKNNPNWEVINKKVIKPSDEEVKSNPRSRSAKLRLARRK